VAATVAGAKEPVHIATVLEVIEPAVTQTKGMSGYPVENAVRAQVLSLHRDLVAGGSADTLNRMPLFTSCSTCRKPKVRHAVLCMAFPVSSKKTLLGPRGPVRILFSQGSRLVITRTTADDCKMPSENHYYAKVVLNDNMPADDSLSGREIQLIVGSPSKLAESALVEFATEFTRHIRMNQGWSTVHVMVEPIDFQELPVLGQPTHTEGDQKTWIVE
jgi:hypothetical protein